MEQTAHDMLKQYPCYNEMSMGEQLAMKQASMEIAIAYHKSECEEAGRELPTISEANEKWEVTKFVASLQFQLVAKETEIERLTGRTQDMAKELNQFSENYAKAVSQLEAQDKQVEGWKNLHKEDTTILQKQLQEAKAEAERLSKSTCDSCGGKAPKYCRICDNDE